MIHMQKQKHEQDWATPVDLCPRCGKQIQPEDLLTSDDDEIFYHVNCDDPAMRIWVREEVETE